ncbi:hypothetical protein U1Q18_019933 [Sarracenia purpurea var. burkii]
MEESGGLRFEGLRRSITKKRSKASRRPRPESLPFPENRDWSPLSSTAPSDVVSKISGDENTVGGTNSRRKEFNLNQCASRGYAGRSGEYPHKKIKEDGSSSLSYDNGDFRDSADQGGTMLNHRQFIGGFFSATNWKSTSGTQSNLELQPRTIDIHCRGTGESQISGKAKVNRDGVENDKKVKRLKLKVGGVTRTIQTKSNLHGVSASGSSTKSSRTSDVSRSLHRLIFQGNPDDHSPPDENNGLRGVPWKDFARGCSSHGKEDSLMGKIPEKNASGNEGKKSESIRKSKRVPKRRVLDGAFDEDDEDDEIRYLEKLRFSKAAAGYKYFEEESGKKQRFSRIPKNSKHDKILEDFVLPRSTEDSNKKPGSERGSEDADYEEEEELPSDGESEGMKKKKPMKDSVDSPVESRSELALTTRQRALLSSKDDAPSSVIEFPNGLPPAPPRKQKEKLSEVEQQMKKAEAAKRRKMQVEKAAQESEAEAIRKILGQDSSRKKREDKMKKRREEIEQEKAANALVLASNTIRWVMGPTGTVVTFSNDMGLPCIFNSKPFSYPPPREKCAGPSCTNTYKYRDSKSKLPLCSLHCYKAIHEKLAETTS